MIHKELDVWKVSVRIVKDIYQDTKTFPKDELYGLTSQIRRCAISIPSNIAEGSARNSNKDYIRFLNIAAGSCAELDTQLIIANELNLLTIEKVKKYESEIEKIGQMLHGLIRYLRTKEKVRISTSHESRVTNHEKGV
jgi:four helix bundle protein